MQPLVSAVLDQQFDMAQAEELHALARETALGLIHGDLLPGSRLPDGPRHPGIGPELQRSGPKYAEGAGAGKR